MKSTYENNGTNLCKIPAFVVGMCDTQYSVNGIITHKVQYVHAIALHVQYVQRVRLDIVS